MTHSQCQCVESRSRALYHGLRHGRAGASRAQVPRRSEVRGCASLVLPSCFSERVVHPLRLVLFVTSSRPPHRLAKDPRFERLPCTHKGTYADDCIVQRVQQHRCYIVATCDRELKRRIRKVPGVPIMYISNRKYVIERLPEANAARVK